MRKCSASIFLWREWKKNSEDIAGVRIICQFEEDIETVASLIQKRSDMVIKSEKNYLSILNRVVTEVII